MEDTLDYIKNCLLIITTVGAIIGVYVKAMSSYFIESIKNEYKQVPGQQSTFEIIINIIAVIIFSVDVIGLVGIIFLMYFNWNDFSILNYNNQYWNFNYSGLVSAIITCLPLIFTFILIITANKLKNLFKDKLHNKTINNSFKKYAFIIILGIFISVVILGLSSVYIISGNLDVQDIEKCMFFSILIMSCITNILISNSLINIITELRADVNYVFHMSKKEISCKCYLEYNEFYLVLVNGVQNFIRKSEISKIEKIDINKRNRNKKSRKSSKLSTVNVEEDNPAT